MPRSVVAAGLFLVGVAAAIAPVTWRNHHVSGEWVLTTTQLGQNLYTGNNPENPYGAYGVVSFVRANPHFEEEDFRAAAEARAGRPLGAARPRGSGRGPRSPTWRPIPDSRSCAFLRKAVLFWNDFEISDSQDQYLLERVRAGAAPAAARLRRGGDRWRRSGSGPRFDGGARCALLAGFVLVYWATLVAFFLFARYRIQVVPALLPLAALGVREAWCTAPRRRSAADRERRDASRSRRDGSPSTPSASSPATTRTSSRCGSATSPTSK